MNDAVEVKPVVDVDDNKNNVIHIEVFCLDSCGDKEMS